MNGFRCRQIKGSSSQSGAAAIEMALIFPILLAVTYAGVVYSYVYVLQQAINFAAQQGAQAAVAIVPSSSASADLSKRLTQATLVSTASLSWLPPAQFSRISSSTPSNCGGVTPGANTFVYQMNFALGTGGGGALFPSFVNLPYFSISVPPLPVALVACAVAYD